MTLFMGPTGGLCKGHVLDVSEKPFVQRLKDYDAQLYVKWNPKKLRGWGCWEIRRKPEEKTAKYSQRHELLPTGFMKYGVQGDVYEFNGFTIVYPKYHELDLINHVLDVAFLNYSVIDKLKKMDMWNQKNMGYKGKNFNKEAEYLEAKHLDKIEDEALKELDYGMKQHKAEIRDFKEYVASGNNPYKLADHWMTNK